MELNASFFVEPERSKQLHYAKQGLLRSEEDKLLPGLTLYRVGHSNLGDEENLSSPWWMDYEAYVRVKTFAETNHISLTVSHRVPNAVAPAFGSSDVLCKVQLRVTLRAFIGAGRPIESDGQIFWPPHDVKQIFIPGLRSWPAKIRSPICRQAFGEIHVEPVQPGLIPVRGE